MSLEISPSGRSLAMVDYTSLYTRLTAVDSTLVPLDSIRAAKEQGARATTDKTVLLPCLVLDHARQNPVLGVAIALGAVNAAAKMGDPVPLARSQLGLGIAVERWGYYDKALSYLEQVASRIAIDDSGADHLYMQWHRLLCERRLRAVPDSFERLMVIAGQLQAQGKELDALRCRLDSITEVPLTRQEAETRQILQSSEAHSQSRQWPGEVGHCLILRAAGDLFKGKLEAAWVAIECAEEAFTQANMPAMIGFTWLYRGLYFYKLRDIETSRRWLLSARDRAVALQHDFYLASSLLQLAHLEFEQGNIHSGIRTQQAVTLLAESLKLRLLEAHSRLNEANMRFRQGEYEDAAAGYRQSQHIWVEIDNQPMAAVCTMNLGIVARRQGHFSESLKLLHGARTVFQSYEIAEHLANVHHNLGKTYAALGHYEPAIDHFQTGIDIAESAGILAQAARPTIYLVRLLAECGETARAWKLLAQADEWAKKAGLELDLALCERVHADLLLRQGEAEAALETYQHSLGRFTTLGQEEAAWEAQMGIADAHLVLGHGDEVSRILEQLPSHQLPASLRWHYHALSAQLALLDEHPRQAMEAYVSALKEISRARRTLTREDESEHFTLALQTIYDEALALAFEMNDIKTALYVVELHSAQLLSARIGHPVAKDDLTEELAHLAKGLSKHFDQEWTVLRYSWHRRNLWLFCLTPSGTECDALPLSDADRMALQACASADDSFRQRGYTSHPQGQANAPDIGYTSRQRLCEALLPGKVREHLSPDHMLIIVPSGELHGLAFHALLHGGDPLIMQTRVLYARSLELLRVSMEQYPVKQPGVGRRGLIMAASQFDQAGYPPLPHVEHEVVRIAAACGCEAERLSDADLTRDRLASQGESGALAAYDWLHIATHAYVDSETGLFSGLLFGKDVIRSEDIGRWQTPIRLVMLSACQTALGRWYAGDEVVGLAQAFLGAGAQTVIASLWLAADERSADLIASFYKNLNRGELPSTALALAQREAHRRGISAYYWAPFSAFGHP